MNIDLQSKISIWRQKALDNTLTVEEMKDAIIALRNGRVGAAIASDTARRKKAVKVVPSADDLLSELDGLL
jgi:hypothetical protein